jgi:Phosphatidate phosphatase APP1, catalytic domain
MPGIRLDSITQLRRRWYLGVLLAIAIIDSGSRILATDRGVSNVREDELVLLFPTCGWREVKSEGWILPVHGCVYEVERRRLAIGGISEALKLGHNALSAEEKEVLAERCRLFMVDNQGGKRIVIAVGSKLIKMDKSSSDGQFRGVIRLSDQEISQLQEVDELGHQVLRFGVLLPTKDTRVFSGVVHLAGQKGVTVISDIDDTIKLTRVRDRSAMIRSTFLEPFQPVPGMAELYRVWQCNSDAQIWYVSASPWQLYYPLSEFLGKSGFPSGPVSLKSVGLTGKTFFDFFKDADRFKKAAIEPILKRFPDRSFVLVGDSGERDPEVYGELARNYPHNIVSIFIRDTTSEPAEAVRYREAFRDLPPRLWRIFVRPAEVPRAVPGGLR